MAQLNGKKNLKQAQNENSQGGPQLGKNLGLLSKDEIGLLVAQRLGKRHWW